MRRRFVAILGLLGYLSAIGGFQPAFLLPRIPANERFPCEGHGCGCVSATACWTTCCCQSPAERLAWAREVGVTPPTGLTAAVDAAASCCSSSAASSNAPGAPAPKRSNGAAIGPLKCSNLTVWVAITVLTLPSVVDGELPRPPCGFSTPPAAACVSTALQIEPPPPRRA